MATSGIGHLASFIKRKIPRVWLIVYVEFISLEALFPVGRDPTRHVVHYDTPVGSLARRGSGNEARVLEAAATRTDGGRILVSQERRCSRRAV